MEVPNWLTAIWATFRSIIIGVVITIVCVILLVVGISGPGKPYFDRIMNDVLSTFQSQYREDMKQKDEEIQRLNQQLIISQQEYTRLLKDLSRLKQEALTINAPKDIKETKDRFGHLGYTPTK